MACVGLLVLYCASVLKLYLPYVNYCINYKYISTVLCENKNKPEMHCNGKCHLKKTIKQAEEEDSKSKNAPNTIKVFAFQEMPATAVKFKFRSLPSKQVPAICIAPSYASPVMEIICPPPQTA